MKKTVLCTLLLATMLSACATPQESAVPESVIAPPASVTAAATLTWLDSAVEEGYAKMVEQRHYLHQHPELGNQEYKTQAYIADYLESLGIKTLRGTQNAPTAVIGIINEGKDNAIGLRADIDALPITERTGLPYASQEKGLYFGQETDVYHGCGHDAHMAMLLAAAKILQEHATELPRTVVLVFQPAEEGDSLQNPYLTGRMALSGAKALVADGILDTYGIEHMFGIHVMIPPSGTVLVAQGTALNSVDAFMAEINGEQTHGAMPWQGVDATLAASACVMNLQHIVSRNANLSEGMGVISVGKLTSGDTSNVISGRAEMQGTIRASTPGVRATLLKRLPEVLDNTAKAYGASADTTVLEIYPVTVNDPYLAALTVDNLKAAGVNAAISKWNPGASEDFSFFAEKVPSVFMFLGVTPEGVKEPANNHSDRFLIDDAALKEGVKAHVTAAFMTPL